MNSVYSSFVRSAGRQRGVEIDEARTRTLWALKSAEDRRETVSRSPLRSWSVDDPAGRNEWSSSLDRHLDVHRGRMSVCIVVIYAEVRPTDCRVKYRNTFEELCLVNYYTYIGLYSPDRSSRYYSLHQY